MTRCLGPKPFNWPAAILVFGWIGFTAALLLGGDRLISPFRHGLPSEPLAWWPEMSIVGLLLIFTPLLLGGVAGGLPFRLKNSVRIGVGLVALGVFAFTAGVVWDANSGVALYSDQLVYRDAGFGQPLETRKFTDIRRTESSCLNVRERRSWTRKPRGGLTLDFGDGRRFEIWDRGGGWGDRGQEARFLVVERVFAAAGEAGAVRAPQRRSDGRAAFDSGCPARLANRLGVPLERVSALLVVDQSELRPDEYVVRSED
ncbi:hypothetical protein [Brevundimonas sp.]|uniref:hypothetical protein n=1 Tax=Brevundimonas sp. TaxID=1871086 RepID=UPI001223A3F7|nr:hypothetical protein [Brevundimonas sp.]TAJ56086.1 MAG: hypothetical protein EPO49_15000 [Brevundimonas sp.]